MTRGDLWMMVTSEYFMVLNYLPSTISYQPSAICHPERSETESKGLCLSWIAASCRTPFAVLVMTWNGVAVIRMTIRHREEGPARRGDPSLCLTLFSYIKKEKHP